MKLLRKRRPTRRGAALVEMALVLLLLLTLTFAILEYGWIFLKSHHIANAARQGARIAATPDATPADVDAAILADDRLADVDLAVDLQPARPEASRDVTAYEVCVLAARHVSEPIISSRLA